MDSRKEFSTIGHRSVNQISPNNLVPPLDVCPSFLQHPIVTLLFIALFQIWVLHSLFVMMICEQILTSRGSVSNPRLDASF
jgi:hypothetical protein